MRHDSSIELLLFAISAVHLVKAETCLNQAQLAGIVFGVSLGTLVLAISIAFILWWVTRGRRTDESIIIVEKAPEKAVYENGALETEHKATEPIPLQLTDKMTSCHSLKQKHRLKNIQRLQSQRSRSSESLDKLKELKRMAIENRDIAPLGFDIQQSDGRIFIDNIKENGPADKSGNMFVGDRIKTLCVSFEGMLLEDAINILSYAAPYKMKLELERTLENEGQKHAEDKAPVDQSLDIETTPHHAFRSISLNSLSSDGSGQKLARGGSWMSKQKYALPRDVKHSDPVSPASTAPIGSLQDSYPESSSPTVSTATESSSTLPISAVFEKEPTVPSLDAGSAPDQEIIPPALPTSLPPSLPTTSSPAVSPTMIPKSLPPKIPRIMPSAAPKASRLPIPKYSPKLALKIEEVQRDGIDEFVEVSHFTYSKPSLSTRHCQQVEFCERLQPKRKSIIVEFKENHHNNTFSSNESNQTNVIEEDEEFMEILRPERELTHVEMPPRIVGIKVEKIPSSPSPKLIERKLPPLPKMLDIPVKEQKNGAALYIEQKESLRKTIVPPKTTESDVILRKEHRARLDANRSLLERQQEELRALGVLP